MSLVDLVGKEGYWLNVAPAIVEVPDHFLLLGIDGDHRIASRLILCRPCRNVAELRVAIRLLATFADIPRCVQAIVQLRQQVTNTALADHVSARHQFPGQMRRALARPSQC